MLGELRRKRLDDYILDTHAKAFASSKSEECAEVAAREARARATGAHGPAGVAAYRRWLVQTGRVFAKSIIAQVRALGVTYSLWSNGSVSYSYAGVMGLATPCKMPVGLTWKCTITGELVDDAWLKECLEAIRSHEQALQEDREQ